MTLLGGQTVIQPNWDIYGCCKGVQVGILILLKSLLADWTHTLI